MAFYLILQQNGMVVQKSFWEVWESVEDFTGGGQQPPCAAMWIYGRDVRSAHLYRISTYAATPCAGTPRNAPKRVFGSCQDSVLVTGISARPLRTSVAAFLIFLGARCLMTLATIFPPSK